MNSTAAPMCPSRSSPRLSKMGTRWQSTQSKQARKRCDRHQAKLEVPQADQDGDAGTHRALADSLRRSTTQWRLRASRSGAHLVFHGWIFLKKAGAARDGVGVPVRCAVQHILDVVLQEEPLRLSTHVPQALAVVRASRQTPNSSRGAGVPTAASLARTSERPHPWKTLN